MCGMRIEILNFFYFLLFFLLLFPSSSFFSLLSSRCGGFCRKPIPSTHSSIHPEDGMQGSGRNGARCRRRERKRERGQNSGGGQGKRAEKWLSRRREMKRRMAWEDRDVYDQLSFSLSSESQFSVDGKETFRVCGWGSALCSRSSHAVDYRIIVSSTTMTLVLYYTMELFFRSPSVHGVGIILFAGKIKAKRWGDKNRTGKGKD